MLSEPSQHMKVALKGIKIHLGWPRPLPPPPTQKPPGNGQGKGTGKGWGCRIDIEIYATDLTNNVVKSCQTRPT